MWQCGSVNLRIGVHKGTSVGAGAALTYDFVFIMLDDIVMPLLKLSELTVDVVVEPRKASAS
jgi:hypothetical protein